MNWTDVSQQLPPNWKLVWLVNDGVVVLGWHNEGRFYTEGSNTLLKNVTKWTELTKPTI